MQTCIIKGTNEPLDSLMSTGSVASIIRPRAKHSQDILKTRTSSSIAVFYTRLLVKGDKSSADLFFFLCNGQCRSRMQTGSDAIKLDSLLFLA